jgi:hypothetical protein
MILSRARALANLGYLNEASMLRNTGKPGGAVSPEEPKSSNNTSSYKSMVGLVLLALLYVSASMYLPAYFSAAIEARNAAKNISQPPAR